MKQHVQRLVARMNQLSYSCIHKTEMIIQVAQA